MAAIFAFRTTLKLLLNIDIPDVLAKDPRPRIDQAARAESGNNHIMTS